VRASHPDWTTAPGRGTAARRPPAEATSDEFRASLFDPDTLELQDIGDKEDEDADRAGPACAWWIADDDARGLLPTWA
jgi:hypothetical protein